MAYHRRRVTDNYLEFLLRQIPRREAWVVERIVVSDWPKKKVAERLNVSPRSLYRIIQKAMRHLKEVGKDFPLPKASDEELEESYGFYYNPYLWRR